MSINNEGFSYDDYAAVENSYTMSYDDYAAVENSYTMSCDNCGDELHDGYGFGLFDELIEMAKLEGWRFTKDENGEWYHYCPSCAKKLNLRIGPSAAQDFEGVGSQ